MSLTKSKFGFYNLQKRGETLVVQIEIHTITAEPESESKKAYLKTDPAEF